MKKSIKLVFSLILIFTLSTSLSASSLIRDITGKENKGITVKYNNQVQNLKDGNGKAIYPVIISGSTYLPVRAIADMLGADITWEGETKTIYITGNDTNKEIDNAVPTDLPSTNSNNSNKSNDIVSKAEKNQSVHKAGKETKNKGTLRDPVEMGTSYSYNYTSGWENNIANADYKVTVTKVRPITRDDIYDLGFERPKDNPLISYVMVTVKLDISNATYQGDEYYYLNMYTPAFIGTEDVSGNSLISYNDFGFKNSFEDNVEDATKADKLVKVFSGERKAFTAEGDVIVGVFNNCQNHLTIRTGEDWEDRVYFKLY